MTDLTTGATTHDDCKITATHIANARKVAKPGDRYILSKATPHQDVDAAIASVLAHEAAADARAAGWGTKKPGLVRARGRVAAYWPPGVAANHESLSRRSGRSRT